MDVRGGGEGRRPVVRGDLPDVRIGRWWSTSGSALEVDVLGLDGTRTALVGEAKWTSARPTAQLGGQLRSALARLPSPVKDPELCLWTRDRRDPAPGVRHLLVDVIDGR